MVDDTGAMPAGLTQLADTFVSDPNVHYTPGQTVRAQVVAVDASRGRISLNLRPAATAVPDGSLLASLFSDLETANALRCAGSGASACWCPKASCMRCLGVVVNRSMAVCLG